jgi:hypothetical protein
VTRVVVLALALLAGCGGAGRTLYVRGGWAESYGFACECGERHFQVLAKIGRVRIVCIGCGRAWDV